MHRPKRHKPLAEINVVPYIDVMLVLLVIFMVTTPLLSQGVKVDLPSASAKPIEAKHQEPIIVSVDALGNYYLNIARDSSSIISSENLENAVAVALKHSREPRQVLIKGDRKVDYGKVMQAMVLLQRAGAPSVGLVTVNDQKSRIED